MLVPEHGKEKTSRMAKSLTQRLIARGCSKQLLTPLRSLKPQSDSIILMTTANKALQQQNRQQQKKTNQNLLPPALPPKRHEADCNSQNFRQDSKKVTAASTTHRRSIET
jgi:hypothetical protein